MIYRLCFVDCNNYKNFKKIVKPISSLGKSVNKDNSSATEDIEANFEGKEIEIGFNAKYIMDMLENLKENEILISFMDNSSPIIAQEKSNPDLVNTVVNYAKENPDKAKDLIGKFVKIKPTTKAVSDASVPGL